MVIGVRPEKLEEYKRLHEAVWPQIVQLLSEAQVRNFSIFHKDAFLFGYFEYHGTDLAADFARMNAMPIVKEWYAFTNPCQVPFATRKEGEWWAQMEEVFHME
jgi:L-rhamnose mutarotase